MCNKGNELVSFRLGVHAEYTTSRELLEGMAELVTNTNSRCICIWQRPKKKWKNVKCVMVCHCFSFWIQLVCLTMAVAVSTVSGWMNRRKYLQGEKGVDCYESFIQCKTCEWNCGFTCFKKGGN